MSKSTKTAHPQTCWLVFDAEKKGSENQCRGLAESLGVEKIISKPIPKSKFLQYIPRRLWPLFLRTKKGILKNISSRWPDLIISSGTRGSTVAAFLHNIAHKETNAKTKVVNILDPRLPASWYDLVIAPEHDRLTGINVLETRGTLHRLTPKKLKEESKQFSDRLKKLSSPVVTVLIGGSSKSASLTPAHCAQLAGQLSHLYRTRDISILASFSRRTSDDCKEAFKKGMKSIPMQLYDGKGDNPYFAYLEKADYIIVTADSVSMVAEACSTGKPVFVVDTTRMPRKFSDFHKKLTKAGSTKPFKGLLEDWDVTPLRENDRIAKEVRKRLGYK